MGRGTDFGLDLAVGSVHAQRTVGAMDGDRLAAASGLGSGVHGDQRPAGVAFFALHDLCAGAAFRLQQNDPFFVAARRGEIAGAQRGYRPAITGPVFVADGRDGTPVVVVDLGGLHLDHLDLQLGLHPDRLHVAVMLLGVQRPLQSHAFNLLRVLQPLVQEGHYLPEHQPKDIATQKRKQCGNHL